MLKLVLVVVGVDGIFILAWIMGMMFRDFPLSVISLGAFVVSIIGAICWGRFAVRYVNRKFPPSTPAGDLADEPMRTDDATGA
jgi:hypothetical protein